MSDQGYFLQTLAFVENKWLDILKKECLRCFSNTFLPSHDCSHHIRVWNYAKQIMLSVGKSYLLTAEETEILLLACFFHDTGMSIDPGPRHGQFSRNLCSDFLQQNGSVIPKADILLSIVEEHDQKDTTKEAPEKDIKGRLLALLHMADDLDAFGATGVYRYTEIYLIRGIPSPNIPGNVLPNLENRFNRIKEIIPTDSDFHGTHFKRFLYTRQFFSNCLNTPTGLTDFAFLTENIATYILGQKQTTDNFAHRIIEHAGTPSLIRQWARDFIKELEAFRA